MPLQAHRHGQIREYYTNEEFYHFFLQHGIIVTSVKIVYTSWRRQFFLFGRLRSLPMDLPASEYLRLVRWDLKHNLSEDHCDIALAERYAPPQPTLVPRLVIVQEHGVVQTVLADAPVDVLVLDYDTEPAENNPNLVQVPQIDGTSPGHTEPALFLPQTVHVDPACVHELYNLKR